METTYKCASCWPKTLMIDEKCLELEVRKEAAHIYIYIYMTCKHAIGRTAQTSDEMSYILLRKIVVNFCFHDLDRMRLVNVTKGTLFLTAFYFGLCTTQSIAINSCNLKYKLK